MPPKQSIPAKVIALFRDVIRAALKPREKLRIWEWLDKHVIVPTIVGSPYPGPLDTGLMPQWRGLLEKYENRRVRFFTLCKSARVGGSLFFGICLVLHKIATWPGPILWIDPTRKTARRFSRQELQPFMLECRPVAELRIPLRTHWTVTEMVLRNCTVGLLGTGSSAELGGRQGELIILNEEDKIDPTSRAEAPPSLLAIVRSKLFAHTRKIVRNSTPTLESGLIWGGFVEGSQLHCYVPCPECNGWQRLAFFKEPEEPDKWMRVDADDPLIAGADSLTKNYVFNSKVKVSKNDTIRKCPDGRGYLVRGIPPTGRFWWPAKHQDKKSKAWDVDAVERDTRYECAFCQAKIPFRKLNWMNARYAWRAHNSKADSAHESAHIWAAYSPLDLGWGGIAKKYLQALGNVAKMHDLWNSDFGRPFERTPTRITRKSIELLQKFSPKYERANPLDPEDPCKVPARPCFITMEVDVQQTEYWWTVWAHTVDGAMWLLAWGSCVSDLELKTIAAREWTYDFGDGSPIERHSFYQGIKDGGYKAKRQNGVYRFVHENADWMVSRGGKLQAGKEKPIFETTIAFNYDGKEVDIPYIHYNDDQLKEHLYRFVIKERQHARYLPVNLDDLFIEQVTSEYLAALKMHDGRTAYEWRVGVDPHLGDCWKEAEIFHFIFNQEILAMKREQQDAQRAAVTA